MGAHCTVCQKKMRLNADMFEQLPSPQSAFEIETEQRCTKSHEELVTLT